MSEYAVTDRKDAGTGSLLAALAEAAFLIGIERNRSVACLSVCMNFISQFGGLLLNCQMFVHTHMGS